MANNPVFTITGRDATAEAWAAAQRTAQAGIQNIGSLMPSLAGVLTAAGMVAFAKHTIDAGDALNDMSEKTGLSVESLSKWQYIAEQSNTTLEEMQPAWKKLAQNMDAALAGGKSQIEMFRRLGITADQLKKMDLDDAALAIADAFQKMPAGPEKAALAVEALGKQGQAMIPVLSRGRAELKAMGDDAERMGMVMSTRAAEAAAKLNDSFDLLETAAKTLGFEMLNAAAPGVAKVAEEMAKATKEGGIFWGIMRGYGEAFRVLMDGGVSDAAGKQKIFIRQLQDEYAIAAKNLQYLQRGGWEWRAGKTIKQAEVEVAALNITIQQAVQSLRILEQAKNEKPKPKGTAGTTTADPEEEERKKAAQKAADAAYKLFEQQAELEEKGGAELRALRAKWAADDKKEDEEKEARRFAAHIAQLERDQQEINAAQAATNKTVEDNKIRAEEFKDLRERMAYDLADEMTQSRVRYEQDMDQLWELRKREFLNEGEYQKMSGQRIRAYEADKTRITDEATKKRWNAQNIYRRMDIDAAGFFAGQMAGLMQTNSRKLFEIGKAGAIAGAIIDTYKAATGAYAALASIPIVGPALGAAAAAAAIAVGMARVSAIKSQQFGSSGGAVGTYAANPSTGLPESPTSSGFNEPAPSPIQQQAPQMTRNVNLSIDGEGMVSMSWVRDKLLPMVGEALGDGVSFSVNGKRVLA